MKIVVQTPNWVGDAVLSMPTIQSLKNNFPQAEIWLAGKEWVKDLFALSDFNSGMIPLSRINNIRNLAEASNALKEYSFDLGLILPNSFSSALLFYLAKIPQRWGYSSDGRRPLLTKGISPRSLENSCHQVYYYLNLLKALGLQTVSPELKLTLSPVEKDAARKELVSLGLNLKKPLVILHPGASYGPAKRWPPSRFAELGMLLQESKNAEPIITGSQADMLLSKSIISLMKNPPKNLTGKTTIRQLLGVISHASLFITNDSGPMHIANAMKIPVVAIFGPTDHKITGPFHEPSLVIKKEVACWPCHYRECPYDHRCMMNISAEEVHEASLKFLG